MKKNTSKIFILLCFFIFLGAYFFSNSKKNISIEDPQHPLFPYKNGVREVNGLRFVMTPKPTGPLQVATRPIHVEDPSRQQEDRDEKRHWMIQSFFSAPHKRTGLYPYAFGFLQAGELHGTYVETHASPYTTTDPKDDTAKPILIIVPSLNYGRFDYSLIAEELASYGFIVFVTEVPGVTPLVRFNTGKSETPRFMNVWNFYNDKDFQKKFTQRVILNYQIDLHWILNNIKNLLNFLNVKGDLDRVLLFGHADSTPLVRQTAFEDQRVAGLIEYHPTDLKPFHILKKNQSLVTAKPTLLILSNENLSKQQEGLDLSKRFRFLFRLNTMKIEDYPASDNKEIWKCQGEKNTITDYGYLSYKIPAINNISFYQNFTNWLFQYEPNIDNEDVQLIDDKPDEWIITMRQKLVEWLTQHNFLF